jgi:hypothetical protein
MVYTQIALINQSSAISDANGPYNHNNTLTAPFTLSPYGYVIALESGNVSYLYGSKVSKEKMTLLITNDDLSKRGAKKT